MRSFFAPLAALAIAAGCTCSTTPKPVAVSIGPASATIVAGGTQQFTATVTGSSNTAVTWTVSVGGGTITSGGLFTAPSAPGTSTVLATSAADKSKSASATVTVVPPVAVSVAPPTATVFVNTTQTFTATVTGSTNTAVAWTVTEPAGGSVTSGGIYTAPAAAGTYHVVATSAADATKFDTATVTVPPVVFDIGPAEVDLDPGASQAFTATVSGLPSTAVTWTVTESGGGSVTNAGVYTAPTLAGVYHVVATSAADSSRKATATVHVSVSISGTVAYTGSLTGRVYLEVVPADCSGCAPLGGTSIPAPGPYRIRGVRLTNPAAFVVKAWRDATGETPRYVYASDPVGTASGSYSGTSVTGADITLSAAGVTVAPVTPARPNLYAGDGAVLVVWNHPRDEAGNIIADHYNINVTTTSDGCTTTPAGGTTVPVWLDTHALMTGFTNGHTYCFTISATNNGVESNPSTTAIVTVGPFGGGTTLTGTVQFAGISGAHPLLLAAIPQGGTQNIAFQRIASPVSPQAFSIPGVTDGTYSVVALFDLKDDGLEDAGDPGVGAGAGAPTVVVSTLGGGGTRPFGALPTQLVPTITVPASDVNALVATRHFSAGGIESFGVGARVLPNLKVPASVAITSGAGVVAIDLALAHDDSGLPRWEAEFPVGAAPVASAYGFALSFLDDSAGTAAATTGPVLAFATATAPAPGGAASSYKPTFRWTAPSPLPTHFTYRLSVRPTAGAPIWDRAGIASDQTVIDFNDDGKASQPALDGAGSYALDLTVEDDAGNRSEIETSFDRCPAETDAQFCTRLGKQCGFVYGTDNCGATRAVADCAPGCSGTDTCGGGGLANTCGACTATCTLPQRCGGGGVNGACGGCTAYGPLNGPKSGEPGGKHVFDSAGNLYIQSYGGGLLQVPAGGGTAVVLVAPSAVGLNGELGSPLLLDDGSVLMEGSASIERWAGSAPTAWATASANGSAYGFEMLRDSAGQVAALTRGLLFSADGTSSQSFNFGSVYGAITPSALLRGTDTQIDSACFDGTLQTSGYVTGITDGYGLGLTSQGFLAVGQGNHNPSTVFRASALGGSAYPLTTVPMAVVTVEPDPVANAVYLAGYGDGNTVWRVDLGTGAKVVYGCDPASARHCGDTQ